MVLGCQNTVHGGSCVRGIIGACEKTPRKESKSLVISILQSTKLFLESVLVPLLGAANRSGFGSDDHYIYWGYSAKHSLFL